MIYCDLDGVLADFDGTFLNLMGKKPDDISKKMLWTTVLNTPDYWLNLKLMPDSKKLIDFLKGREFTILTGIPHLGHEKARVEKRLWVDKHLGTDIPVICCYSSEKKRHYHTGDILIDDFEKNITEWRSVGGTAIHHTSAIETIEQLKKLTLPARTF